MPPYTPILIGVADTTNRSLSTSADSALEPLTLMLQSIHSALRDTSLPTSSLPLLQSEIDSIDVVATWTWPYADLAGLVGKELGLDGDGACEGEKRGGRRFVSEHGGNQPAKLVDEAARRVGRGECKVAVVTGGEALASLSACAAAKKMPPPGWTQPQQNVDSVFTPSLERMGRGIGAAHGVGLPIQIYPMYENSLRAHRGQSIAENNKESARLYAEFAQVAEKNENAWGYGVKAKTEEEIGTVGRRNRMICFPYPLLMNAFNTVNLAGAVILTSAEYAREIGVPEDRWVYPLGGAGTKDADDFWMRPNFHNSPAISRSLDAGLQAANLTTDQIDIFDFYSCFPIVPKLACKHLDLPYTGSSKPITLLGGLTSFGGAGNNYSMHAITEMTRQLRDTRSNDPRNGLVLANGGVLTYQHVLCLSSHPRNDSTPYPEKNPLPEILADEPVPPVDENAEGEATVETYTVSFSRSNEPDEGHIVGRLSSGHRFVANHGDKQTLLQLVSTEREPVGRRGWVRVEEGTGKNLFSFEKGAKM